MVVDSANSSFKHSSSLFNFSKGRRFFEDDHFSVKPRNVTEFDSSQLSGKNPVRETVYCLLPPPSMFLPVFVCLSVCLSVCVSVC